MQADDSAKKVSSAVTRQADDSAKKASSDVMMQADGSAKMVSSAVTRQVVWSVMKVWFRNESCFAGA